MYEKYNKCLGYHAWFSALQQKKRKGEGGGGEKGAKGEKGDCLNVFCLFLGLLCFSFRPAEHLIELNYSSTNERMLRSFLMPAN